eukprot:5115733-Alexandrium_andersonii.AAC.1
MLKGSEVPSPGCSVNASDSAAVRCAVLPWRCGGKTTSAKGSLPNAEGAPVTGPPGLATGARGDGGGEAGI